MKRRLVIYNEIQGDEDFIVKVSSMPTVSSMQKNKVYKYLGKYYRLVGNNVQVVDSVEFPYIGTEESVDFTYSAQRMGTAPSINAKLKHKDCLDDLWKYHTHVVFNGEKYYVKPSPSSSKDETDTRYEHDIDFYAERTILENVYFYDVVAPFVPDRPVSQGSVFSFFGGLKELADRINASLVKHGICSYKLKDGVESYLTFSEWNDIATGEYQGDVENVDELYFNTYFGNYNAYLANEVFDKDEDGNYILQGFHVVLGKDEDGNDITAEEQLVSVSNIKIYEALQLFKDTFDVSYYFGENKEIVVGDCQYEFTEDSAFEYGYDNELLKISKTTSSDSVINRITGIGSTENIPYHYPNPTPDGWLKPAYKRNSMPLLGVDIAYEREDSLYYDKFLKNRLGQNFTFGNFRYSLLADLFLDTEESTADTSSVTICYKFEITDESEYVKFNIGCSYGDGIGDVYATKDGVSFDVTFDAINGSVNLEKGVYCFYYKVSFESFPLSKKADYHPCKMEHVTRINGNISSIRYRIDCLSEYKDLIPYQVSGSGFIWCTDRNDPEGTSKRVIYPTYNTIYRVYQEDGNVSAYNWVVSDERDPYASIDGVESDSIYSTMGKLFIIQNIPMDTKEFANTYMTGSIDISKTDGWYLNGKAVQLADYGMTLNHSDLRVGDVIYFERVKYLTPQKNLMPEIYYLSDGYERFYDAVNYPREGGADTVKEELREEYSIDINGNDSIGISADSGIYKDEDGNYLVFANPYNKMFPSEKITEHSDIKPSIKNATYNGMRIDVVEEFAYDELDDNTIWEDGTDGDGGNYKHPHFFAKLRPLGFNLFEHALQDDMVISMTTGHCGSCNFKIKVDENHKKNPVQVWEDDVYEYVGREGTSPYRLFASKGDLKRYKNIPSVLYIHTENGYKRADNSTKYNAVGVGRFTSNVYSASQITRGAIGSLNTENNVHIEGDVITSGSFQDIQQDTTDNYVWVALEKDTETFSTIMPSSVPNYENPLLSAYLRPISVNEAGDEDNADKFVILNIRMPQRFIRSAESLLSETIIREMCDENVRKNNFSIDFSRIFFEQNKTFLSSLNENSVIHVKYNNKIHRLYVSSFTYTLNKDEYLPEIKVDLDDELAVITTLKQRNERIAQQRIDVAIKDVKSGLSAIKNETEKNYVSKKGNSVISGNLVSRVGNSVQSILEIKEQIDAVNDDSTIANLVNKQTVTTESIAEQTERIDGINVELEKVAKSVGKIDGQTITIGETSLDVVSSVSVEGVSVVKDGKADITYVSDLDNVTDSETRAASAKAVSKKSAELKDLIGEKYAFKIVKELPTDDIDERIVYTLIKTEKEETKYVPYLYYNGEFVMVGSDASSMPIFDNEILVDSSEADNIPTEDTPTTITANIVEKEGLQHLLFTFANMRGPEGEHGVNRLTTVEFKALQDEGNVRGDRWYFVTSNQDSLLKIYAGDILIAQADATSNVFPFVFPFIFSK